MLDQSFSLQPAELLAAWRPRELRLHLTVRAPPRPRDRATLRIALTGSEAHTVLGTIAGIVPGSDGFQIAVAPDAACMPEIRKLLYSARGLAGLLRRPPRWLARLPATATLRESAEAVVTTTSLSAGGCGLSWSDPPAVGRVLRLQVSVGALVGENRGSVCWRSPGSGPGSVGVQFAGRPPASWAAVVAEVVKGGAPRA